MISLFKTLSTLDTKKLREVFKDNKPHYINSMSELGLPDLIFVNEKNAWDPPVVKEKKVTKKLSKKKMTVYVDQEEEGD